jgi:thymidylate synthase
MNRQVWTNQKQHLSTVQNEENADDSCILCGGVENTMHLIFECQAYAEPLWALLQRAINSLLRGMRGDHPGITLHAYNIMYNKNLQGITGSCADQIHTLIQEIKRNMVFRRCNRMIHNRGVRVDQHRITCHLMLSIQRLIALREFQGKGAGHLNDLHDIIRNF